MFENILGQEAVVTRIMEDVGTQALPGAVLFNGPEYAGKLSTALELARSLSCTQKNAPWNCSCLSCRQHRVLMSPYTLMLGHRYFADEIRLCGKSLSGDDREGNRYLFLRAVRKLTNRFEPLLWEGEDQKLGKASRIIDEIEESLDPLQPGRPGTGEKERAGILEKLYGETDKLLQLLPADGATVNMIRRLTAWTHISGGDSRKTIIIENAERLNDAASNSLLKILEEPPTKTNFILTTTRLTGLMPTLRSRLRVYTFPQRSQKTEQEVLNRIFRIQGSEYAGLRDVFLGIRTGDELSVTEAAQTLFDLVQNGGEGAYLRLRSFVTAFTALPPQSRREAVRHVLQETGGLFRNCLASPQGEQPHSPEWYQAMLQRIDLQYQRLEGYNIGPETVFEQIFFGGILKDA
ncbi:hypothetical protein [Spirochaeta lutea]|uniref:hypothetical protein n=1 Tax=Spirochaeta lutea TaxID=1480694 RepID=UPI000691E97C|nr:hypothetical protein [Spirochaeta lutea]